MKNYDTYKDKILKLREYRDFLYRFRVLFISIFLVIAAIISTLLGIKGITYDISGVNNVYVYGEKIDPYGKAILSSVNYEYKKEDESSWHKNKPTKVGNYLCRYYTNKAFNVNYSEPVMFSIVPKKITLSVIDKRITYGDKPKVLAEELVKGDYIDTYDIIYDNPYTSNTMVAVDTQKLTIRNSKAEDITDCYDINVEKTNISIEKRPLGLKFFGAKKEYDSVPLNNDNYEITSGSLAYFDKLILSPSKYISEIGSVSNDRDFKIINDSNVDVTNMYYVYTDVGDLVITPRHLLIKTNTVTKTYDGKPASLSCEITEGSLLHGHSLMTTFLEKSTSAVGEYENIVTCRVFDNKNNREVNEYYDIEFDFGIITIKARELCIKTGTAIKIYDGKELSDDEYSFVNGTNLIEGDDIVLTNHTVIVDNGSVENVLEFDITRNGVDVSDCYKVTYEYGTLTIKKRPINVTIDHLEKVYDGTPLVGDKYYVDNLAPNQTSEVVTYSSLTKVGTVDNSPFEIRVFNEDNVDCTFNYEINYQNGEGALKVTKRPLHIKTRSMKKPYDGKPLVLDEYDILDGTSLANGDRIEATFESKNFVDNGVMDNRMSVVIFNPENEDVTFCYDLQIEFGRLEIEKVNITVRTANFLKQYDGKPFASDRCFVTDEALPEGHRIIGEATSDGIDVGVYPLITDPSKITILNAENKDVTYNFIITFINSGFLNIEKREIVAKPKDEGKVYDGLPLFASDYEIVSANNLVLDHVFKCDYEGSVTDVLDSPAKSKIINPKIISEGTGRDVTFNYGIELIEGKLSIFYKKITVTSCDYSATYNGEYVPIENFTKYTMDDELLPGHTMEVEFNKTPVKNVIDSRENEFSCVIYDQNHVDITDKYMIEKEFGKIEIKPILLTVQINSKTVVYDGNEHSLGTDDYIDVDRSTDDIRIIDGTMVKNEHLKVYSYVSEVMPGDYRTEFAYRIVDGDSNDLDSLNYIINRKYGFLYIKKINLTVESKNGRKVYDGSPFENDIWISTGYLLNGHSLVYSIDENITEIGTYENFINDFKIVDANYNDVTDVYYNVTLVNGKVVILDPNEVDNGTI